jgi:hypothetical protein
LRRPAKLASTTDAKTAFPLERLTASEIRERFNMTKDAYQHPRYQDVLAGLALVIALLVVVGLAI